MKNDKAEHKITGYKYFENNFHFSPFTRNYQRLLLSVWKFSFCRCLCPAKLVANISLTPTGDTTTQIMAPTVGGGF